MNSYAAIYRNPMDVAINGALFVIWILVGLIKARRRFPDATSSEAYFLAASRALFVLSLVIGVVFLVGLIFLVWLKISSGFWFFWGLLFFMSAFAIFWATPAFSIFLFTWALIGKKKWRYGPQVPRMLAYAFFGIAADVLLYFVLMASWSEKVVERM